MSLTAIVGSTTLALRAAYPAKGQMVALVYPVLSSGRTAADQQVYCRKKIDRSVGISGLRCTLSEESNMAVETPLSQESMRPEHAVRGRAISVMAWISGSFFVSQVLMLLQGMFAAHYLNARGLGIWGIATIFNNLYRGFMQSASPQDMVVLSTAEDEVSVIHSVFYANLIRSLILAVSFLALGPILVTVYHEPELLGVMALFAAAFALDGLRNPGLGLAFKRFDFKPMVLVERGAQVAGLLLSLGLLALYRNIWAVVIPIVLARILFVVLSYLYEPTRPTWSKATRPWIQRALSFSFYLAFLTILGIGVRQGPDFLISNAEGLEIYGKYSLLYLIASIPVNAIAYVIDRISFPLYSRAKDDPNQLGELVTSIQMAIFLITTPLYVGFFVAARPLLSFMPGDGWLEHVTLFSLLTIYAMLRAYAATYGSVYKLSNQLQRRYNLIVLSEIAFVLVVGTPVLLFVSLNAYVVIMCAGLCLHIVMAVGTSRKLLAYSFWKQHNIRLILLMTMAGISITLYKVILPQNLRLVPQLVQSGLFVLMLVVAAAIIGQRFGLVRTLRGIARNIGMARPVTLSTPKGGGF